MILLMQLRYKWCAITGRNSLDLSSSKPEKALLPVFGYQFLVTCDSSTWLTFFYRFQSYTWNILLFESINYKHMLYNMLCILIKNNKPCIWIPSCYIRLKMKSCVRVFYETEVSDTVEKPAYIISNLICNLEKLSLLLISARGSKGIYFSCPKSSLFILLSSVFASTRKRLSITCKSDDHSALLLKKLSYLGSKVF